MNIPNIPESGLKPQLVELLDIAARLKKETDELRVKFLFNPPATDEEIRNLEVALDIILPLGYKEFLLFSNGARLCGHSARFGDIKRVIDLNSMKMSEDFPSDYVIIAEIIGDGEVLCFSKNTGRFIRYFDGNEIVFDDFYAAFNNIIKHIKIKAEDYIEL